MKKLSLISIFTFLSSLFLVSPQPTHAQLPFLTGAAGACSNSNVGTGSTVSCPVNNTLGRAQLVAVKWCDTDTTCTVDTSADTFSIADTVGNAYTCDQRLDSASGTDRRGMAVCHAANIGASASNTVTLTVTSGNAVTLAGLVVNEVGGVTAAFIPDAKGTLDVGATASPAVVSTTGATARGNELIYTWVNINAGTLAVGQPIYGAMGTNYFAGQLGTPTITGSGTTAVAEWNNSSPRNNIKQESMSFNASGFTLNPTAQQRGIIVTYYSPAQEAPTSLTFSNQEVSTTSATQTITFTNTGLSNIFISAVSRTGTNAADYTIDGSSTCAASVNVGVGATCKLVIKFTPSTVGTRTANINLFTSASGSPHVATLSGNGITGSNVILVN